MWAPSNKATFMVVHIISSQYIFYSSPLKRKRRTTANMMEASDSVIINASEFIEGK